MKKVNVKDKQKKMLGKMKLGRKQTLGKVYRGQKPKL